MWQDVRYAFRTLLRTPGFTAIAVLTLALGIGANTAIFSLVHAVILKPLPFRDPSRLVTAWDTYLPQFPKIGVSPVEWDAWREQTDVFDQTAWYRYVSKDLDLTTAGAEALEVHVAIISDQLLPLLGVAPVSGRAFTTGERPDSALLSYRLWRQRFGGDRRVVGKSIRLNDQEFTVVGVMGEGFKFPDWADMWIPRGPLLADEITNPIRHSLGFVGRLHGGITEQQAAARLETIARRLAAEHPKTSTGFGIRVSGLQDDLTANVRPALLLLLGAVALVLLIACGNVANLLLARASGRRKEIAVRNALGAGAGRIARQLLTEGIVLAMLGGGVGLGLGEIALSLFSLVSAPLDGVVLLFLLAVSIGTGIVFGLAPALQALRSNTNAVIKSGAVSGGGAGAVRSVLVVAEFALALMLVAGAGILVKSFLHLMHVDPGFEPKGVLTMRISIPPSRQPDALFHRIEKRMLRLPGVDGVASTNALPLNASRANTSRFNVPGSPLINPDALPVAQYRGVSPDYFRVMRIPLRSGRAFTERDLKSDAVIINETMARRFWPGRDPVGLKYVTGVWGPSPTSSTIVGVVGDVKEFGLDSEPTMDEYFPALFPAYVVVHSSSGAGLLTNVVRGEMQSIDPDLPVSDVRTMDQILAESAESRRWTMALLACFATLALVLALVGIYGVMSWSVAQRVREIGIRVALGADSRQVVGLVLGYGMKLSAVGLVIGLAGAFALRRVMETLVFDVSTSDPWVYTGVAGLMVLVAMAACYIPARRASRVDPLIALRCE
jgi:putative ABC transport system permease protein